MSWVYILKSEKTGRFYIGSTKDLARRLKEHQSGKSRSLKYILPVKLVFKQRFTDFGMARKIELKLKKLKRKDYLKKIIQEGTIKMDP